MRRCLTSRLDRVCRLVIVFTRACLCILIRSTFIGKGLTFYQRVEAPDITHTRMCLRGKCIDMQIRFVGHSGVNA